MLAWGHAPPCRPLWGPLPLPTPRAHILQKHTRGSQGLQVSAWAESLRQRQQHAHVTSTIPGRHSAGHVLLFLPKRGEDAWQSCLSRSLNHHTSRPAFQVEEMPVGFHTTPSTATEQKGPSEFPGGHQGGDNSDDEERASSTERWHTNHRAVAHFRRRLEAGLQQTFRYSSSCSSFNNTSLQFITSCPIVFAVSPIALASELYGH